MRRALITGISGQDGAYLAEFLIKKKYKIIGTTKSLSRLNKWRLKKLNIEKKITYDQLNLFNKKSIDKIFEKYKFDEIYNFAGHSFVATSFKNALNTSNNTGIGVVRILENIKKKIEKLNFTKLRLLKYLVVQKACIKMKNHLIALKIHTLFQNYLPI